MKTTNNNIPLAEDFCHVHDTGPLLSHHICPTKQPGEILELVMKEKLHTTWDHDTFGIRYANGNPYKVELLARMVTGRGKMVLRSKATHEEIVVMLKLFSFCKNSYKLYGFHPLFEGQNTSSQKHEGRYLYEWATVTSKSLSFEYIMTTANNKDKYVATMDPNHIHSRLTMVRNGILCAFFKQDKPEKLFKEPKWHLTIGPGIDPCLMISFVAVVEQMMGLGG